MSSIHQESCQDVRRVSDSRVGRVGLPALPYVCLIRFVETSVREYCRKKYEWCCFDRSEGFGATHAVMCVKTELLLFSRLFLSLIFLPIFVHNSLLYFIDNLLKKYLCSNEQKQ